MPLPMPGKLIIARHQESDWNKEGLWTGQRNRHLTENGFQRANEMGMLIEDIYIDLAFASMMVRTIETLSCMLEATQQFHVPTHFTSTLNERDYGDYTSKNKWEMLDLVGEDAWEDIRRGWNVPIPHGETLKMVYERAIPFFESNILPPVKRGKQVLVVGHGNTLRAVTKYIERISDEAIRDYEVEFGTVTIYSIDPHGHMITKEVRRL